MKKIVSKTVPLIQSPADHIRSLDTLTVSDTGPYGSKSANMGVMGQLINLAIENATAAKSPFAISSGQGFAFDTHFYDALITAFQVKNSDGEMIPLKLSLENLVREFDQKKKTLEPLIQMYEAKISNVEKQGLGDEEKKLKLEQLKQIHEEKLQDENLKETPTLMSLINQLAEKAGELFSQCYFQDWPEDVQSAFDSHWDQFAAQYGELTPVHVRSSSPSEDNAKTSGAGQNLTVEAVAGKRNVQRAIVQCMASSWKARSISDRVSHEIPILDAKMPVCIVKTVKTCVTGVGFSCDNISGNRQFVSFELLRGMGSQLVGAGEGAVPSSYQFNKAAIIAWLEGKLTVPPYDAIMLKKLGRQETVTYTCDSRDKATLSELLDTLRRQCHHDYNFEAHDSKYLAWAIAIATLLFKGAESVDVAELEKRIQTIKPENIPGDKQPSYAELSLVKVVLLRCLAGGGVQEDPCDSSSNARFPVTDEQAFHIAVQIYLHSVHFKDVERTVNERDTEFSLELKEGNFQIYATQPLEKNDFNLVFLQNRKEVAHSGIPAEDYSEIAAEPLEKQGLMNLENLLSECKIDHKNLAKTEAYLLAMGWITKLSSKEVAERWGATHIINDTVSDDNLGTPSQFDLDETQAQALAQALVQKQFRNAKALISMLSYADNAVGTGPIHIVRLDEHLDEDMEACPKNAIIVVAQTSPELSRVLEICNGIISMAGGKTCHGALISGARNSGGQHIAKRGKVGMIGSGGSIAGTMTISIDKETGKKSATILLASGEAVVFTDGEIATVETTSGEAKVFRGEYLFQEIATSRREIAESRPKLIDVGAIAFDNRQANMYLQLFEEKSLTIQLLRGEFIWQTLIANQEGVPFHPKFIATYQQHIEKVQSKLTSIGIKGVSIKALLSQWHRGDSSAKSALIKLASKFESSDTGKIYGKYIHWLIDLFQAAWGYDTPRDWVQKTILQVIGVYAANVSKVKIRLYDSKPEELENNIGAESLECGIPNIQTGAVNPDFGHRGTGLFLDGFEDVMEMEMDAIFTAMRIYGEGVVQCFAVFVRTPQEFSKLLLKYTESWQRYIGRHPELFGDPAAARKSTPGLGAMIEIASNNLDMCDILTLLPQFVSVGSNDMKASLLAMCRILSKKIVGEEKEAAISMLKMFTIVATASEASGCPRSCCGNAPSINPHLAKFLALLKMDFGIKTSNMGATMKPIRDQELEMLEMVKARLQFEKIDVSTFSEEELYHLITIDERLTLMKPLFEKMLGEIYNDQAQDQIKTKCLADGTEPSGVAFDARVEIRYRDLLNQAFQGIEDAMITARDQGIKSIINRMDLGEAPYPNLPVETLFRLPVKYLLRLPKESLALAPEEIQQALDTLRGALTAEQVEQLAFSLSVFSRKHERIMTKLDGDLSQLFTAIAQACSPELFKLFPDIRKLEALGKSRELAVTSPV